MHRQRQRGGRPFRWIGQRGHRGDAKSRRPVAPQAGRLAPRRPDWPSRWPSAATSPPPASPNAPAFRWETRSRNEARFLGARRARAARPLAGENAEPGTVNCPPSDSPARSRFCSTFPLPKLSQLKAVICGRPRATANRSHFERNVISCFALPDFQPLECRRRQHRRRQFGSTGNACRLGFAFTKLAKHLDLRKLSRVGHLHDRRTG